MINMQRFYYTLLALLTIFGIISLARRRFESKQLVVNAAITLIIWSLFLLVLAILIILYVAQVEY